MYKKYAIDWASGCRHDKNFISLCLMQIFRLHPKRSNKEARKNITHNKKFLNVL